MCDVIKFYGLGIKYNCVRSMVIGINEKAYLCNLILCDDDIFGWDVFEISNKSNALYYVPNTEKRNEILKYIEDYIN